MPIFYSEERRSGGTPVPYEMWKANDSYLTHYSNMMMLDFIAKNSKDGAEAAQARKEIEIALKKMNFWKHHQNYDQDVVMRGIEKIKKDWRT